MSGTQAGSMTQRGRTITTGAGLVRRAGAVMVGALAALVAGAAALSAFFAAPAAAYPLGPVSDVLFAAFMLMLVPGVLAVRALAGGRRWLDAVSGIAPDEQPRVFEAFFRGAAGAPPAAGTGLGLAICRAFVEANGGTVELHSGGAASGTTVRFRLPVPAGEALSGEAVSDE